MREAARALAKGARYGGTAKRWFRHPRREVRSGSSGAEIEGCKLHDKAGALDVFTSFGDDLAGFKRQASRKSLDTDATI